MPDDTPKKSKSIKLALFLPWDKTGRLFNPDKYTSSDEPPAPPVIKANDKILKFPDEKEEDDET
jgi:hypothetical protein